jgi:hypothetical protein
VQHLHVAPADTVNAQVNAAVHEAAELYMVRDDSGRPYWKQGRKPAASITAGADNTKGYLQEGKVHAHSGTNLAPCNAVDRVLTLCSGACVDVGIMPL